MARGAPSPAPALPKVSFVKIDDESLTEPAGVPDQQARSYGYNDGSHFHRPEPYIRYIEPLESELAVQVEYDMDEQDQEWLDAVNAERKSDQLNKVTYETFEIIMDRLEKEWFDLTKNIPKPDMALPSEDSTCAICDDAEGENSNAIVFCDGCNLAVHQDCYGVPYIPEGQWLCRKCTVSPENPVSCILCPNEGGAFKQTVHGEWAHLLCAIWVPETRVANEVFMEPITGEERINKQRWKLKCSLCGIREGACIQCSKTSCFLAFHATCARREKLLMPMKSAQGSEPATLAAFCEKHLPPEQQEAHRLALAELDSDAGPDKSPSNGLGNSANIHTPRSSKKARAYAKTYKLGPPLVPAIIVQRILDYIARINVRRKPEFLHLVCRYWSLKREGRRGAPLLKRLHLEPWTASATSRQQTDEEKATKLEYLKQLRNDLELVRMLAERVRKRELLKLKQAQLISDLLSNCLFPHEEKFEQAFDKIQTFDRNEFFKTPVSRTEVPDYYDVIKSPMCWNEIERKLEEHRYWDVKAFENDIYLVLNNATTYNKSDTPHYRTAHRMKNHVKHILAELEKLARPTLPTIETQNGASATHDDAKSASPVGDLEPPLMMLELLRSADAIRDDTDLILTSDPLHTLFAYEFGNLKPPPPPPPPKPKKAKKPRQDPLDAAPGFRAPVIVGGPRTRRARAAEAAFEAEAGADGSFSGDGESHDEEDNEASGSKASKKPASTGSRQRWRRPMVLPGHADVPPVVDDVDNQRSFKMFDEGWILPSSQRRGGRAPIEKHDLPPPRKKIRLDHERSRLSVFSTAASENQTLRENTHETDGGVRDSDYDASADHTESMEIDQGHTIKVERGGTVDLAADISASDPVLSTFDLSYPGSSTKVFKAPSGTIIIEELDTPATRRAKAAARKAQRKAGRDAGTGGDSVGGVTSPSRSRLADEASELSELSELEESVHGQTDADGDVDAEGDVDDDVEPNDDGRGSPEEDDKAVATGNKNIPKRKKKADKSSPLALSSTASAIVLKKGRRLESGTLVWAKADTYPWWAGVIYDVDHSDVPENVLNAKPSNPKGPIHLIKFFDKKKSWQWLELDKLKLLGEDKELDDELLDGRKKLQRFKSGKIRSDCKAAYIEAVAEMETDADTTADTAAPNLNVTSRPTQGSDPQTSTHLPGPDSASEADNKQTSVPALDTGLIDPDPDQSGQSHMDGVLDTAPSPSKHDPSEPKPEILSPNLANPANINYDLGHLGSLGMSVLPSDMDGDDVMGVDVGGDEDL
ncbi:hypothetical protein BD410DRAFT_783848 [Rickenella mellea]|uniref:Bromodomain-containing protein n=1 Tax=Rickenella mellea TaxID=50990 RepID=A0A4Y7QH35_9AGAM|nr:hypothetical protein BD410DRAFT_783848 [Rickenella mellea]